MCLPTKAPRFEVLADLPYSHHLRTPSDFPAGSLETPDCGTIFWMKLRADTVWIVDQAKSLGLDLAGVVRAEKISGAGADAGMAGRGYAGEMRYLADPRRGDPRNGHAGDSKRHRRLAQLQHRKTRSSTDPAVPSDEH